MTARHFDASFAERVALRDGTEVTLRLIRPADKALLERGFERMSERSRFQRFFVAKNHLSPLELRYLTELDGENHFAMGAACSGPDGDEVGVGVARFVRLDQRAAEPAITVIDAMQGKGLGRVLFLRLCAAARERGIERFSTEVLAENVAMRKLLHDLAPEARETLDGDTITVDVELPHVAPGEPSESAAGRERNYRLLSLAAQGLIRMRRAFAWLGLREPGEDRGSEGDAADP